MVAKDYMKLAYCEALLSICKEKNLNKITVNDVIKKVGTARQTFYNHFRDINDLVSYVPIAFYEESQNLPYTLEGTKAGLYYSIENKEFFSQVPFHKGQNSFRESYIQWIREVLYAITLEEISDEEEYLGKKLCIDAHAYAAVDLYLDWCREGMEWPVEVLLQAMYATKPDFIPQFD